jgi:energy-coupling factor transporter ATP-binding protein EcfA2
MTSPSYIDELRLTSFKSFSNEVLPFAELTLLIGRNGSGKSNALDALEVLSKLAQGEDIRDALEGGRRDSAAVRGGVEGCAPHGEDQFTLGCRVRTGDEVVELDVTVQVRPQVQVIAETITGRGGGRVRQLLYTGEVDPDRSDIGAQYWNNKRGADPRTLFRSSRLLTSQVATRVPTTPTACKTVHRAAGQILEALGGVFILDPVPHLMRQYVPERDTVLRRQGENMSAVIGHLRRVDRPAYDQLVELLKSLPEQRIKQLLVERSSLGDVMIALAESQNRKKIVIPARLMSDGMLRFLAFTTALLDAPLNRPGVSGDLLV